MTHEKQSDVNTFDRNFSQSVKLLLEFRYFHLIVSTILIEIEEAVLAMPVLFILRQDKQVLEVGNRLRKRSLVPYHPSKVRYVRYVDRDRQQHL